MAIEEELKERVIIDKKSESANIAEDFIRLLIVLSACKSMYIYTESLSQELLIIYSAQRRMISTIIRRAFSISSTWICSSVECSSWAPIPTTAISIPLLL